MNINDYLIPLLMWFIETRDQILYYIKVCLNQLDANSKENEKAARDAMMRNTINKYFK